MPKATSQQSRPVRKLHPDSILFGVVQQLLRLRWSPEQIALALALLHPKGHRYRVSHETIYNCIHAQPMRLSMTYDQGREMALHKKLTEKTGVAVYFCDPHSPWQRGSSENINGLVRQYLPKGTDLSGYSQEQLDAIADEINNRPRKGLGVRSPLAVYRELLLNSPQHSTLIH